MAISALHFAAYAATGGAAGFLAGLLGVGGGIVIVPALTFVFTAAGMPAAVIPHMAVATSLGAIVFSSLSSLRSHHRRGAVEWPVVARFSPGIVAGTFAGSLVASTFPPLLMKRIFLVFLAYVIARMLRAKKPSPGRSLPGAGGLCLTGSAIGGVSSIVGIGGGSMTVPFLSWCNVPMHAAIGTSAAVGLPIALAGTAGYVFSGLQADLPAGCAGFVFIPAVIAVSSASILTAPLGARVAHALPVQPLKRIFALLLIAVWIRMFLS